MQDQYPSYSKDIIKAVLTFPPEQPSLAFKWYFQCVSKYLMVEKINIHNLWANWVRRKYEAFPQSQLAIMESSQKQ